MPLNSPAEHTPGFKYRATLQLKHRGVPFPRVTGNSEGCRYASQRSKNYATLRSKQQVAITRMPPVLGTFGDLFFRWWGWLDLPLSLWGVTAGISDTCLER